MDISAFSLRVNRILFSHSSAVQGGAMGVVSEVPALGNLKGCVLISLSLSHSLSPLTVQ